ncbi:MAG: PilZ domain-containing protein [Chitinophagaceae bacterium]|nr:PilZ domain-containing protein [Oligoflexus sp.]
MSSVAENLLSIDQALGQTSLSLGLMIIQGWEKPIEYALYEICHHNIGVITSVVLEIGTPVFIERSGKHIIPMIVHQAVPTENLPGGYNRYRLISVDPETDFEVLIPELAQRTFHINDKQLYHVRFARFKTEIPTRVDARTFGSPELYSLKTLNVSKSGFLLASPPGFRVPFNEATLLELTIHVDDEEPISFLGRVIRCEFDFEKKMKRYGINICDITAEARERYDSFIEDTEHKKNRQIFRLLNVPMPV